LHFDEIPRNCGSSRGLGPSVPADHHQKGKQLVFERENQRKHDAPGQLAMFYSDKAGTIATDVATRLKRQLATIQDLKDWRDDQTLPLVDFNTLRWEH
jgi:hypothetical protein